MNTIIIWFAIIGTSTMIVLLPKIILLLASEYIARIEQTSLEIAENQEPVDQTIILWWGLDGLRLNEDGSMEWISRKKPKPVNQNVSYQPCQAIQPIQTGMLLSDHTQSTRAQIDALQAMAIYNQIFMTQIPYQARYLPQMQSPYTSQLTQCCCDWNHLYGREL